MKRSRSLSLILMGALALGGTGCGSDNAEEGSYTFTSINECVRSEVFSEAECMDFARSALNETPRFSSREDCEKQFGEGACAAPLAQSSGAVPTANGTVVQQQSGSSWMPMMMGFMAGRFLSGGGMMQGAQGLYRNPAQQQQQQGAGTRSFRTATGDVVQSDTRGRVSNPSSKITRGMSHNAKPVVGRSGGGSRGGFFGGSSAGGGS